jgi:hypothetical protein
MPATFITARALKIIDLNNLVNEKRDPFDVRYRELLENPQERDPEIVAREIGKLVDLDHREKGDEEAAKKLASDLAWFVVRPFSVIADVPLSERGLLHSTGAALVSEIARLQAWTETTGIDALEIGEDMGRINRAAAQRMTPAQIDNMATEGGIKETIAQMAKEEEGE